MLSSRIAYAPELLPDELFYSWLARLAQLNAIGSPRECLMRIFGINSIVPSVDLPTRLLAAQQQMGDCSPFETLDDLLEVGTLLPYHRPFLNPAAYSRVREILVHGDGKGLKVVMGRVANRFGANPPLRSCPACLTESVTRHGCFYWMRRHQLPGVSHCSIHAIPLQALPLEARTHRQRLVLPVAVGQTPVRITSGAGQVRFAELSEELVSEAMPALDPHRRSATYEAATRALGFVTRRGRVDFAELASALRRRFEDFEGFEHQERLLASAASPLSWIRPLIEIPERSLHPICHLLLIEFLFGSVTVFKSAYAIHDAQGTSVLIPAYPDISQSTTIRLSAGHEAALRDTSMSCRQVAALTGHSVTTIVAWRRSQTIPIRERRKTLSPSKVDQILGALASQASLPSVAERFGVSLSSVYRILAEHPSTRQSRGDQALAAQTTLRRGRWSASLQSCQNQKEGGVVAARAKAGADYAWLYRHDRAWLLATTRVTPRRQRASLRVDWVRRDADLSQRLLHQVELLRAEHPSRRLTKTRLLRVLGEAMVRRNLHNLPTLDTHLTQAIESAYAFGVRRIEFALATLISNGPDLQLWRVKRLAGLRVWSAELTAYANSQTDKLNAQNTVRTHSLP